MLRFSFWHLTTFGGAFILSSGSRVLSACVYRASFVVVDGLRSFGGNIAGWWGSMGAGIPFVLIIITEFLPNIMHNAVNVWVTSVDLFCLVLMC